jgi:hypothetical protein
MTLFMTNDTYMSYVAHVSHTVTLHCHAVALSIDFEKGRTGHGISDLSYHSFSKFMHCHTKKKGRFLEIYVPNVV